jgi:hypothetical protein
VSVEVPDDRVHIEPRVLERDGGGGRAERWLADVEGDEAADAALRAQGVEEPILCEASTLVAFRRMR